MASNSFESSMKHNIRLSDMIQEPKRMLPPIKGFENLDLVSLEKAVAPLISIIPEIDQMVYTVKQNCDNPKDSLTPDESASIMLYSMEWTPHDNSFYFILNKTLRSEDRQLLKPWFLYLRLFIHALSKLPSTVEQNVYRGIKLDLRNDYPINKTFVWWGFSSCTNKVEVLENEEFFGKTGQRTLFTIECHSGKDIRNHSMFPTENEILLMAATQFQVISNFNPGNGLYIIQIKEIQPPFVLIPHTSGISTTSSTKPSKISYQNKELEDRIRSCHDHSEINLDRLNLTDQDMDIVVREAIINKQCRKLSLENNSITSNGAMSIIGGLTDNTTLETLILYNNRLLDLGVNSVSNALSTNNSYLKILSIGSNSITDLGVKYLCQMLKTNQSLILLGLVFNEITDQGVRLLADTLINTNQTLEILHLSKNKMISDSSFESVNQMLKRNHKLKELWIQQCNLSNMTKEKLRGIVKTKINFRLEL